MLKQLSLQDVDAKSCSITETVSEHQPKALLRFLNRAKETTRGGIGIYQPGQRKAQYFRFSYRSGSRTKHRHIPGGNIHSALALQRAMEIQHMADRGVNIEKILETITNFS